MRNDCRRVDPDYTYTDPKTGVLRNLGGLTDHGILSFIEAAASTKRTEELIATVIRVKNSDALFDIHRHLFQDLYDWAGKRRAVEINKGGQQFFPTSRFDNALRFIDDLIAECLRVCKDDKEKLAKKLAEILDTVNFLHPFREGNGRTQRLFIMFLAKEKGYTLNLNPTNNKEIYARYMNASIDGDVDALAALIFERLRE
ncbi:MAG: Fic family protein [Deltaproteobacteria bacterium]|jgi:cell filamentation protein|nr:Fic family protein [Deltaproteobacteria bacterium]